MEAWRCGTEIDGCSTELLGGAEAEVEAWGCVGELRLLKAIGL